MPSTGIRSIAIAGAKVGTPKKLPTPQRRKKLQRDTA